jgi:hypothetical protein
VGSLRSLRCYLGVSVEARGKLEGPLYFDLNADNAT